MNLSEKLRLSLMEQIDPGKDQEDERILEMIDELILNQEESRCLPVVQKDELRRELFYSVRRLDVLQELLDDPEITEIMVN
ncbi:MAG: CpaF family protein, partial [Fusicatenibacter sp.]|nr:CpaF family protein [Fusicatenibacter sp.]